MLDELTVETDEVSSVLAVNEFPRVGVGIGRTSKCKTAVVYGTIEVVFELKIKYFDVRC